MKNCRVYYCSNDHLVCSENKPELCKECSSMTFKNVYGIIVSVEDEDELSRESEDYHSKE